MPSIRKPTTAVLAGAAVLLAATTHAQTPELFQAQYEREARVADAAFAGADAARGARFFNATHGNDWRCASCHGTDPKAPGRHARTGKPIAPLAPSANRDRFSNAAKVDKWFRRNCSDVLARPCTAAEKADVIAYLRSGPTAEAR